MIRENTVGESRAQVKLSLAARRTLIEDVCQRSTIEACGVLIGEISEQGDWQVQQALPLRNSANRSDYFEFAPEELLTVEMNYPGQIVGVYHSHPTGYPTASSTDRANMRRVNLEQQIPWVWLIICGPFDESYTGPLADQPILAYYHYEREGLRQITLLVEQDVLQ